MSCLHNRMTFKKDGSVLCRDCNQVVPSLDPDKEIRGMPMVINCEYKVQSNEDKLKYYGIKDAKTGEGITANTDVRDPIGITSKQKNKRGKPF